ncbi:MAG TPA: hypothetical protein VIE44_19575 [Methylomirabilota bacterium]
MKPLRGATASRPRVGLGLVWALVAGCAAPRIVPVPATGAQIDAGQGIARVAAEGVELTVQPLAWRGSPWDLRDYVTPFLVGLSNGASAPLEYDYTGFRLFDDTRFQYTALPPVEVERILRWRSGTEVRLAATSSPPPVMRRRVIPDPGDWWWDRYGWDGWPWYYPWLPPIGDIYRRALPMGALQPGARLEGFVYFPRLRGEARGLTLEFHHRVGEVPRVLTLAFVVERDEGGDPGG